MALKIDKEEKKIYHNKTIRLPEDTISQINKIASDKNISFNKVVEKLINYSLKQVE